MATSSSSLYLIEWLWPIWHVRLVLQVVVYTASLSKYADPLLDELDIHKVISKRLFRENCVLHKGASATPTSNTLTALSLWKSNFTSLPTSPVRLTLSVPPLSSHALLAHRALREGPFSAESRSESDHHHRQLPHVIHIPAWERNRLWVFHRWFERYRVVAGISNVPLMSFHALYDSVCGMQSQWYVIPEGRLVAHQLDWHSEHLHPHPC